MYIFIPNKFFVDVKYEDKRRLGFNLEEIEEDEDIQLEETRTDKKSLESIYIDIDTEYIIEEVTDKETTCRGKRKRKNNIGIESEINRKHKKK